MKFLTLLYRAKSSNLAGPRPCQGRGRGFESLRPLQDLTDLTTVGRCAQGNIWGNSTHITNALWRSAARLSSSRRNYRFQLVHPSSRRASTLFAIAKFAVGMSGAMAKRKLRSDLARSRIKYRCIDRSSQTRPSRHKHNHGHFSAALPVRISQFRLIGCNPFGYSSSPFQNCSRVGASCS